LAESDRQRSATIPALARIRLKTASFEVARGIRGFPEVTTGPVG
jgi:hypothetical protein